MKKKILIKASGITAPSWRGYNAGVGRSTLMLLKSLAKISNLPFDIEIYASGLSSVGFDFHNLPFKHFSFPIPYPQAEKSIFCLKNVFSLNFTL